MKPLSTVPLTHEDLEAYSYCYGFVEGQSWDAVMIYVRMADRRDADLMLRAQYQRQWLPANGSVPALPPWLLPLEWACGPVGGQL